MDVAFLVTLTHKFFMDEEDSPQWHCVSPKVMILGHSVVRRLCCDLERHFDDDLREVNVRLFGFGGRTVKKITRFDLANVARFIIIIIITLFKSQIFLAEHRLVLF